MCMNNSQCVCVSFRVCVSVCVSLCDSHSVSANEEQDGKQQERAKDNPKVSDSLRRPSLSFCLFLVIIHILLFFNE